MSSNIVNVKVAGLSKCYKMYKRPQSRLKEFFLPNRSHKEPQANEFWALDDVSFSVAKGETVGIVGRNGSGKSTLLQMICGVLEPTKGQVETKGRIAALLELGAGFNPEFTGRENVFFNAAILGLSHSEILSKFGEIEKFADIGHFIDQPVKTYSSGMYARLAFAVAINVTPDILVVDEALAVGDEMFQRKCFARIDQIKKKGTTILFVSHSGGSIISLCDRAMLLHNGHLLYEGEPKKVVYYHQKLGNASPDLVNDVVHEIREANIKKTKINKSLRKSIESDFINEHVEEVTTAKDESVLQIAKQEEEDFLPEFFDETLVSQASLCYDAKGASIENIRLQTEDGRIVNCIHKGRRYELIMDVSFKEDCFGVRSYALVRTTDGIDLAGCAYPLLHQNGFDAKKESKLMIKFNFKCMVNQGTYFCNFALQANDGSLHHRLVDALAFRVSASPSSHATGLVDFDYAPEIQIIQQGSKAA